MIRYQRDCYRVLADAFLGRANAAENSTIATLQQVREMGWAIMQMADEQIAHERRIAQTEDRLDRAARIVGQYGKRLTAIEARVFSADPISDQQASQISEAVKLIA